MSIRICFRCEVCNQVFEKETDAEQCLKNHIKNNEIFSAPCKLNGQPSTGVCVRQNHYESCQTKYPYKNNWMCWRDGILIEV